MAGPVRVIAFLGNEARFAAAATAFNGTAGFMRLPWRAECHETAADPSAFAQTITAESWPADSPLAPDAFAADLIARLLGGGGEAPPPKPKPEPPKPKLSARITRESKGRGGKDVTLVSDHGLDGTALTDLAKHLKTKCGTGGTVKDGRIEIQGDQRDRIAAELERLGYRIKR